MKYNVLFFWFILLIMPVVFSSNFYIDKLSTENVQVFINKTHMTFQTSYSTTVPLFNR